MAQIYLARTTGLGSFERHVVLKTILRERASDQRFVTMFLDEAKLAATLNHQNVAQVYEVDQADSAYFMAMEYVHGEDAARSSRPRCAAGGRSARAGGDDHQRRRPPGCTTRTSGGAERPAAQHRPSRRVARQHHGRLRRHREGARLRHRQGRGARDQDDGRDDQGQVRLHVAGAVQGQADRSPQRHLRARHRAVRADHAAPGVQGQRRLRDHEADRRGRCDVAVGRGAGLSARARRRSC